MSNYSGRHHVQPNLPSYGERSQSTGEFISRDSAWYLVAMVMEGRVDPVTNQLLPLEEERILTNGPGYMMKQLPSGVRHDLVLPVSPRASRYHDGGTLETSQNYDVVGALYSGLVGRRRIKLGTAGAEHLRYEQSMLESTLNRHPEFRWVMDDDQMHDAYHVSQINKPAPNSDGQLVMPTRVYVPGGERGARLFRRVLDAGADFAGAKIRIPYPGAGTQDFQEDTPIFIANTARQLRSVVRTLRSVATNDLVPVDAKPLGLPVEGVPGAFVAQPTDGTSAKVSFNGAMSEFWAGPITEACHSLPLRAGQIVTAEWVDEVSRRAAYAARRRAQAFGLNPACHALAAGQDVSVVANIVRY